jgi:GWxTD domain-containing protein
MIHLINGIAEAWSRYMASATFQATLLALLILGMLRIGRRWPPALRHALLMLALCKFVIPPMLSLPTGLFNRITPQKWSELAAAKNEIRSVDRFATFAALPLHAMNIKRPTTQPEGRRVLPVPSLDKPAFSDKGKFLLLHLLGSTLIFALAAVHKIRLHRLVSRSFPVQDPAILETYNELCLRMKLRNRPRLLISKDNHAPITFGAWKPVVILPQALVDTLPIADIQVIVGHELAHHKRLDPWLAWLQVAISALWWFNPVYWLLFRSIRSVREDCCDDMVLAAGLASREGYCRTLLHAAQAALQNNAMTRAAFAYFGKSQPLRRRFTRIMSARLIRAPKLAMAGLMAIFALALVLLPGIEPRILAQNAALAEGLVVGTTPAAEQRSVKALESVNKKDSERNYILGDLRAEQPHVQKRNVAGEKADSNPSVFSRMDEYIRLYVTNPPDQQQPQPSQTNAISDFCRKWLDEDVIYIITREEKNEFLALRTNNERESFIEQFWVRRGPSFKAEHYRRIAYANEHFASSMPGWKTGRGRIYIMWGKPDEIESHPTGGAYGTTETFPFEKWSFRHIDGVGDNIELEFVDRPRGISEYRIAWTPDEKFTQSKDAFSGSLMFDVRTDYIKQSTDKALVPITIELNNKDLAFIGEHGVNRATVDVYGKATSLTGRIYSEWEDVISLEYSDEFFQTGKNKKSEYQKIIELPPGQRYKLDLVLKDVNGKKAGTRGLELDVPEY